MLITNDIVLRDINVIKKREKKNRKKYETYSRMKENKFANKKNLRN